MSFQSMAHMELETRFARLKAQNPGFLLWSLHVLNDHRGEGYFYTGHMDDGGDQLLRFMSYTEANELLDTAETFLQ